MIVKKESFIEFLKECSVRNIDGIEEVIVPTINKFSTNGGTFFSDINSCDSIELEKERTIDPIKILFYLSRENLSVDGQYRKRILAGVKNCDLKALQITDMALLKDNFVDPSYKNWRENTIIISSDCDTIGSTCHCSLLDGKPYPEVGFDINISSVDDSYYMTIGSEKGEDFSERIMENISFEGNNDEIKGMVENKREALTRQLIGQNEKYSIGSHFEKFRELTEDAWKDESYNCVGCGGCTNICPTCYCIILNDESEAKRFVKVRSYDSCQYNGYARVAGGGTPRPEMFQRFRNRYLCKFDYMESNFNTIGCVGCGRCSDTCPAEIDFMAVVQKASQLTERL